ncbi:hypothetical protein DCAR_0518854 [Daucus carota subsp. sativus]|uniref:Cytochrome P450 n=2 Tax=Daucus carota subsp. sativus TaxID=79200 RepID=A0AAF0X1B8_DAUCS|nr:hypothetical protein DCAR_0518854 [Daucus carota subsp. sativus]
MAIYIQLQDIILYSLEFFSAIILWRFFNTYVLRMNTCPGPPEPSGKWPLIGHFHLLGANKILHHTLGDMADRYGPVFSLKLGINRTLVVTSWEVAKECFTTQDKVFASRPTSVVGKVAGYNNRVMIFQEYGSYWREIRKLAVIELLTNRRLEMLKHVRESEVNVFIRELYEQWSSNGNGSKVVVEMKERFGDLTTNIVVRTVTGKKCSGTGARGNEESRRFQKAMADFMYLTGLFMVTDALPLLSWIDSFKGYRGKMRNTAEEIDHVLGSWLKEHQQKRKNLSINHSEEDFIYVMLSAMDRNQFPDIDTDTAIKGTCLSLILGGYDTTSATLVWALSLILNNRHVLKKAQAEMDKCIGRDRQVKESDIINLPYLLAIVKETLRLYPALPLSIQHEAMKDCTVAGFNIPAGTRLVVNLWKMHRDPKVWSDPLEFYPERFLQKHVNVEFWGQSFEFLPFGSGRRSCPGITFAIQVLHLTLARLVHGFKLGTVLGSRVDMTESSGVSNPKATLLEVTLTPRLPPAVY